MIYQPRNVRPSGNAIDALLDNIFTMEIQTNTYVSAYQLSIIDFNNNNVFSGEKVNLDNYAYNGDQLNINVAHGTANLVNGNNYKWSVKLFQPNADMLITYGSINQVGDVSNIYIQTNINIRIGMIVDIGGESKTITNYDIATGKATLDSALSVNPEVGTEYKVLSDFIETVPDYIFYARKTPVVSINNVPSTLTLKYCSFQGTYEQPDNVPIVYHQFDIYIKNSDNSLTLINTSNKVYSANLTYMYDAFRTGNTYCVQMTVENDMGIIISTEMYEFNVEYDIIEYLQQPQAVIDNTQNAIKVSWVAPVEYDGVIYDNDTGMSTDAKILYNTPYNGVNSLYTQNSTAKWENEEGLCVLPEDYNITLQFNPTQEFYYKDGVYTEEITLADFVTDDESQAGNMQIKINKNQLLFTQNPDINLSSYFYTDKTQVFVLSSTNLAQIDNDYIWIDDEMWDDNKFWVEGGTSIERICNHWWKVQINKEGIKIEEIFP